MNGDDDIGQTLWVPGCTNLLKERIWATFAAATLNDNGDGVDNVDPIPNDGNDDGDEDDDVDDVDGDVMMMSSSTGWSTLGTDLGDFLFCYGNTHYFAAHLDRQCDNVSYSQTVGNVFLMLSAARNHDSWQ